MESLNSDEINNNNLNSDHLSEYSNSTSISDTSINLDHITDLPSLMLAGRGSIVIHGARNLNNDMYNAVGLRDINDEPPLSRLRGLELDETQDFTTEGNYENSEYQENKENTLIFNTNNVSNYLPCFDDFLTVITFPSAPQPKLIEIHTSLIVLSLLKQNGS